MVLEKTLESPLNSKEIKPVNPKGNQPWIFIGRTDAEAEAPITLATDAKSRLIGKDSDAGKDWRQEEKGMTEDELIGWHHQLNGYGFEQTPGHGEGQGSLACFSPWGQKESGTIEWLNNNKPYEKMFNLTYNKGHENQNYTYIFQSDWQNFKNNLITYSWQVNGKYASL